MDSRRFQLLGVWGVFALMIGNLGGRNDCTAEVPRAIDCGLNGIGCTTGPGPCTTSQPACAPAAAACAPAQTRTVMVPEYATETRRCEVVEMRPETRER